MQFGPSLDKRKIQGSVTGTQWHEFIELNRMAFTDTLPRNSESRAIAIAMKILRKHAPQVKWVVSFADATQCGDGTIYRASGFVLTGIKKNTQVWIAQTGARESRTSLTDNRSKTQQAAAQRIVSLSNGNTGDYALSGGGGASMRQYEDAGFVPLPGYQLRYMYFIDPTYRQRLTVPELPYSEIDRLGAGMYRGQKHNHADEATQDATGHQPVKDGASPIHPLLNKDATGITGVRVEA